VKGKNGKYDFANTMKKGKSYANTMLKKYVGQKPTRACVVLLFKYADYK
jgi:hypothetical protein